MDKHLYLQRIQTVPSFPKKFIIVSERKFGFNDIYRCNRRKEFYLGDTKIDKIELIDKMIFLDFYNESGLSKPKTKKNYFTKIWQKEGYFFKYVKDGCTCGNCVKYFCVYTELNEGQNMPFISYGIGVDKYGKSLPDYQNNKYCSFLINSGNSQHETFRATIYDMCINYLGLDI